MVITCSGKDNLKARILLLYEYFLTAMIRILFNIGNHAYIFCFEFPKFYLEMVPLSLSKNKQFCVLFYFCRTLLFIVVPQDNFPLNACALPPVSGPKSIYGLRVNSHWGLVGVGCHWWNIFRVTSTYLALTYFYG